MGAVEGGWDAPWPWASGEVGSDEEEESGEEGDEWVLSSSYETGPSAAGSSEDSREGGNVVGDVDEFVHEAEDFAAGDLGAQTTNLLAWM